MKVKLNVLFNTTMSSMFRKVNIAVIYKCHTLGPSVYNPTDTIISQDHAMPLSQHFPSF